MRISKKSQYGLRSMVYLAKQKDFCSLRVISEEEGVPFDYLEKIFSILERKDLIRSKKGAYGGYTLSKPSGKISVGDILRALEKEIVLVECVGSKGVCPRKERCKTIGVWKKIQDSLEKTINSVTLGDLIKS